MSIFDGINRRIAARLRRDTPQFVVEDDALVIRQSNGAEARLPFDRLARATIGHRDVYAADAIILILEFDDGNLAEFFQDDPQWQALTDALDRSGRTTVQSSIWQVQAIADGPAGPPCDLISRSRD